MLSDFLFYSSLVLFFGTNIAGFYFMTRPDSTAYVRRWDIAQTIGYVLALCLIVASVLLRVPTVVS